MAGPVLSSRQAFGSPKTSGALRAERLVRPRRDVGEADALLMEKIRDGDQRAFRILLERYMPRLVVYVAGIVEGLDAAEDVVQMAFIRLWQHRHSWSCNGSVRAYLFTIARNLALNARRDRSTEIRWYDNARQFVDRSPGPPTPADDLAAAILRREIEVAIGNLPERRREVFILARFHGLSQREIGEVMGITPQTVANQMHAALAELRRVLHHHLS